MSRILGIFLTICLVFVDILFVNMEKVNAAGKSKEEDTNKLELVQTKLSLYVGNTFQLELKEQTEYLWESYRSSDENVVIVSSDGLIRAVGTGEADIIVESYLGQAACHVKVKANHCKLSETKLILYQGQETTVTLTNSKEKAVSYEYFICRQDGRYPSGAFSISQGENGVFSIKAYGKEKAGIYYIDFSLTNEKGESFSARCEVELRDCGFLSSDIAVAEGKTVPLEITNGEIISCMILGNEELSEENKGPNRWGEEWDWDWYNSNGYFIGYDYWYDDYWYEDDEDEDSTSSNRSSYDGEIKINKKGKITGVKAGRTKIIVDWRTEYGKVRQDQIFVDVTTPQYVPFETKFFALDAYYPEFEGLSPYSKVVITSSNEDIIEADTNPFTMKPRLFSWKEGTAVIKFNVDGMDFKQEIQVIAPEWRNYTLIKKGAKREEPLLSNIPKDCEVKWKIEDKNIAVVSKEGKIRGKSVGTTVITATVEGKTFSGTIIVGNGKGTDAALKAEQALGTPYSQEKRMQEGYYDCSSLVWRSYRDAGLKLCGVNYAPTAAELAKKLEAEGKAIAYESLDASELKPGDLIFYSSGNNGRYKNIDHVDIYYGTCDTEKEEEIWWWGINTEEEEASWGIVIGAGSGGVGMGTYFNWGDGSVVMIARPVE